MSELKTMKASVSLNYFDDEAATEDMSRILSEIALIFAEKVKESDKIVGIVCPIVEIK